MNFPSQSRQSVRKYYQGWMHVKQNENFKRMFVQLRAGKELRFYVDETRAIGLGKNCEFCINLRNLKEVGIQNERRPRKQNPEYLIVLKFHSENDAKLRVYSSEERDTWIRFLRAAGLKQLPPNTRHLLPGQIHEIQDIIHHEKQHETLMLSINADYTRMDPISPLNGDPHCSWYYPDVYSRDDAQKILLQSTNNGNMLLRSRQLQNDADQHNFAVSILVSPNPEKFNHYRVKWCSRSLSYEIALADGPHPPLKKMEDIITFFEKKGAGKYRRLSVWQATPNHTYEEHVFPAGPVYQNV